MLAFESEAVYGTVPLKAGALLRVLAEPGLCKNIGAAAQGQDGGE